jgi:hypothetical protein
MPPPPSQDIEMMQSPPEILPRTAHFTKVWEAQGPNFNCTLRDEAKFNFDWKEAEPVQKVNITLNDSPEISAAIGELMQRVAQNEAKVSTLEVSRNN